MTARRAINLLASLVLVTPTIAAAQSRVLIARLGTDTLSIEKFTRTGNTITGTYLMHSPSTLLIGFTLVMRPDGTVASMEQTIADGLGQPVPGQPTAARMRFAGAAYSSWSGSSRSGHRTRRGAGQRISGRGGGVRAPDRR
jgi:hypothetical protein